MVSPDLSRGFRVGAFSVEPVTGSITASSGETQHLEPKVMDVFVCLAERANEMVTRDHLLEAIWSGHVAADELLTGAISALRRALRDDRRAPQYIETVPKKGYRLIEKVRPVDSSIEQSAITKRHLDNRSIAFALKLLFLVMLVATVAAMSGYFDFFRSKEFVPTEYSIAVMPFENLSSDPEQEYFVAGMHDALIAELARIEDLTVISRTSSMHYKETKLTAPEIARALNVAMIVEGSVFKADDEIRIQVQLIDAQADRHLLAQHYDRDLSRVLELQREVTQDIAKKIKVTLSERERSRFANVRRVNPQAYTSYLKGQFFANQLTPKSLNTAIAYFEEAIALDPGEPLAYAGLALTHIWIGSGHGSTPADIAFPRARRAAEQALKFDATLAEAHFVIGTLSLFEWNWKTAETALNRAIEIKRNFADAHQIMALYFQAMQRHDKAIEEIYLAAKLDPLRPLILADVAVNHYTVGQYEQAITQALKGLELNPDFAPSLWILGESYLESDMIEKAIESFEKASKIQPAFVFDLAHAYARAGRIEEARAILDDTDPETSRRAAGKIAQVFVELGEIDLAFVYLGFASEDRYPWLFWIRISPDFDGLRSDPRYDALVQAMNLPET